MIGNDIVDLALSQTESNWKRKGYLDKIFTKQEQFLILNSKNPDTMVWDLWSRKESVYKIFNRQTGIRAFNPLKLECYKTNTEIGEVICMGKIYFTKTEISKTFIHTIAVTDINDFNRIKFQKNKINIIKNNNIPYLYNSGKLSEKMISISHHGLFERIISF